MLDDHPGGLCMRFAEQIQLVDIGNQLSSRVEEVKKKLSHTYSSAVWPQSSFWPYLGLDMG